MSEKKPVFSLRPDNKAVKAALYLLDMLKHNWQFKLLALLIAVALWSFLITQDPTLTRERVFSDVTVTVAGTDAIKRNGFIVTSDLKELPAVSFHVDVPQNQYDAAAANVFNPRIDLSRITEAGLQQVKVITSNSSTYGTVSEVSPENVELMVEEYATRYRIPVVLSTEGAVPEGYYASSATLDPPVVAVSGPKSMVNSIVRAEARLDLASLPESTGITRTAVPFVLRDASGNEVGSSLIQVTSESVLLDTVIVEQTLYAQRTLPLADVGLVVGKPAQGYEIKQITYSPAIITAAGSEKALEALEAVFADVELDVTGLTESVNRQLRLRRPSEVVAMSPDTVTVVVEIGPVIASKNFEDLKVAVTGADSAHAVTCEVKKASVTIEGSLLWIDSLRSSAVSLSVDVTGLADGVYMLPITCTVNGDDGQDYTVISAPEQAEVTIKTK